MWQKRCRAQTRANVARKQMFGSTDFNDFTTINLARFLMCDLVHERLHYMLTTDGKYGMWRKDWHKVEGWHGQTKGSRFQLNYHLFFYSEVLRMCASSDLLTYKNSEYHDLRSSKQRK